MLVWIPRFVSLVRTGFQRGTGKPICVGIFVELTLYAVTSCSDMA